MCNSGVRFMISIFKLDGEESKAIFALEFNETPYLFLYFNQEWVNETDPEVKALKEEYSKEPIHKDYLYLIIYVCICFVAS